MKVFLSMKYFQDQRKRELIENIETIINTLGHQMICVCKDVELWGRNRLGSEGLMKKIFTEIDGRDLILVEFSVKGVGIGIESGYAHARGKTLVAIGTLDAELSSTLEGIMDQVIRYRCIQQIFQPLSRFLMKIDQKMKR